MRISDWSSDVCSSDLSCAGFERLEWQGDVRGGSRSDRNRLCASRSGTKLSKIVEKTMTNQGEPTPPPNEDEENEVLRDARERHEQQEAVEAAAAEAESGKRGCGDLKRIRLNCCP